jgi:hypothetical protein
MALGIPGGRSAYQKNTKEYRESIKQIRDGVNKSAEYSRTHKPTIEDFKQVFKANALRHVESVKFHINNTAAEIWADPNNRRIAGEMIDELVQAITNFKEEFLHGDYGR